MRILSAWGLYSGGDDLLGLVQAPPISRAGDAAQLVNSPRYPFRVGRQARPALTVPQTIGTVSEKIAPEKRTASRQSLLSLAGDTKPQRLKPSAHLLAWHNRPFRHANPCRPKPRLKAVSNRRNFCPGPSRSPSKSAPRRSCCARLCCDLRERTCSYRAQLPSRPGIASWY